MDCLYQLAVVLQGLAPRHTQASKIFLAAVQQDAPLLMGETAALVIQLGVHIPVENEHLFRFKMNADSGLRVHHFRTPQSTNSDVR